MRFSRLKRVSLTAGIIRNRLGKLLFPVLETIFIMLDNLRPNVRQHFYRALRSLGKNNMPVGLLNLNMVLNHHPNHFLARVYRGRIFLKEKQFRLASVDFIRANKISPYRFSQHALYSEYLESVNEGIGYLGDSIATNFNRVFEALRQESEKVFPNSKFEEKEEGSETAHSLQLTSEEDKHVSGMNRDWTPEEKGKFQELGPITLKELEETDWGSLIKKLAS